MRRIPLGDMRLESGGARLRLSRPATREESEDEAVPLIGARRTLSATETVRGISLLSA
jgi:hypothetical protein